MGFIGAIWPKRWMGRIALVWGVDRRRELRGVDHEGGGIDVHEHGRRADLDDRLRRGDEGEGGGEDLVAGTDPGGVHHDAQGVGAGVEGDAVPHAVEVGQLPLDGVVVGAEHIRAARHDLVDGGVDLGGELVVLGLDVVERDAHWVF